MTLHDICHRFKETYDLSLGPTDEVLSFQGRRKIRMTGSFVVLIHLRTGDVVSHSPCGALNGFKKDTILLPFLQAD